MNQAYNYEYTDTFGGETNYTWVQRGTVKTHSLKHALRKARYEIGLTGHRGKISYMTGIGVNWIPRGMCTVLIVGE